MPGIINLFFLLLVFLVLLVLLSYKYMYNIRYVCLFVLFALNFWCGGPCRRLLSPTKLAIISLLDFGYAYHPSTCVEYTCACVCVCVNKMMMMMPVIMLYHHKYL